MPKDTRITQAAVASPVTVVVGAVPARFIARGCHFACPEDIGWALLARLSPGLILSPLIFGRLDVLDLAGRLATLDYRGRYRAVSPPLPRPEVICAEVARQAPGLDFDLWFAEEADPSDQPPTGTSPARYRMALAR